MQAAAVLLVRKEIQLQSMFHGFDYQSGLTGYLPQERLRSRPVPSNGCSPRSSRPPKRNQQQGQETGAPAV